MRSILFFFLLSYSRPLLLISFCFPYFSVVVPSAFSFVSSTILLVWCWLSVDLLSSWCVCDFSKSSFFRSVVVRSIFYFLLFVMDLNVFCLSFSVIFISVWFFFFYSYFLLVTCRLSLFILFLVVKLFLLISLLIIFVFCYIVFGRDQLGPVDLNLIIFFL